ncbi:MAG: hypothetical protein JKX85_09160 [Phycisphaeraceae bacterium]|nr:hypothetical protein [Phycisphaeraceae bacterium]
MTLPTKTSFTGRRRTRRTSKLVKYGDLAARICITAGGVGTILAVALVCVFLTWKVIPLFQSPAIDNQIVVKQNNDHGKVIHLEMDEFRNIALTVFQDGYVMTKDIKTGKTLQTFSLLSNEQNLTAWSFGIAGKDLMLGFEDGSTCFGEMGFTVKFLKKEDAPQEVQHLQVDQVTADKGIVYSLTPEGQIRSQFVELKLQDPIKPIHTTASPAIELLDHTIHNESPIYVSLNQQGVLKINRVSSRKNWMTGKVTISLTNGVLPYDTQSHHDKPKYLKISGLGDSVLVVWANGMTQRFDCRNIRKPVLAETLDLVPGDGDTITALEFMNGRNTLIVGDSTGHLSAWFRVKPQAGANTSDGAVLSQGHTLPLGTAAPTSIAVSSRSRMIIVGFADASAALYQVTVEH